VSRRNSALVEFDLAEDSGIETERVLMAQSSQTRLLVAVFPAFG